MERKKREGTAGNFDELSPGLPKLYDGKLVRSIGHCIG
jgi:hypothetical protein